MQCVFEENELWTEFMVTLYFLFTSQRAPQGLVYHPADLSAMTETPGCINRLAGFVTHWSGFLLYWRKCSFICFLVCWLVGPLLQSRLKRLNIYGMFCQSVLWMYPNDVYNPLTDTSRSDFSFIQWNISTSTWWIGTTFCSDTPQDGA